MSVVDIFSFDVTALFQTAVEGGQERGPPRGGCAAKKSNRGHWALLRARRDRQRRRAAEHRDELAPSHCPMPPVLSDRKDSTPQVGAGDYCAEGFRLGPNQCRQTREESRKRTDLQLNQS